MTSVQASPIQLRPLRWWSIIIWLLAGIIAILVFTAFFSYLLRNDPFPWNLQQKLSPEELSKIVQSAVAAAAALGLGVTLVLSVRRQHTVERTQDIADKSYQETLKLVALQQNQHNDAAIAALRLRYKEAAEQVGSSAAAVQVAGIYAMALLADDWKLPEHARERQMSINVLTAFFALESERLADKDTLSVADATAVRKAIWRSIFDRVRIGNRPEQRWTGADVDLRNLNLLAMDVPRTLSRRLLDFKSLHFGNAVISSLVWRKCTFAEGTVTFKGTDLRGMLLFDGCHFTGGKLNLSVAEPNSGNPEVVFKNCHFSGTELLASSSGSLDSPIAFRGCCFHETAQSVESILPIGRTSFEKCAFADKPEVIGRLADGTYRVSTISDLEYSSASCEAITSAR